MALITCSECKREISNKASNCPQCGCPVKQKSTGSGGGGFLSGIFVALVFLAIIGFVALKGLSRDKAAPPAKSTTETGDSGFHPLPPANYSTPAPAEANISGDVFHINGQDIPKDVALRLAADHYLIPALYTYEISPKNLRRALDQGLIKLWDTGSFGGGDTFRFTDSGLDVFGDEFKNVTLIQTLLVGGCHLHATRPIAARVESIEIIKSNQDNSDSAFVNLTYAFPDDRFMMASYLDPKFYERVTFTKDGGYWRMAKAN